MTTRTQAIDAGSATAPTRTGSPRWSPSQQSELSVLQSGQWWPFQRADAQVLAYLHRKQKRNQPSEINNLPEALL